MLDSLKKSIRRASRSFGYDIVPLREAKDRDFALHLTQLFRLLDIDCVIDVGVNQGQFYDFLREQVLYDGPIVSFEPASHNAARLRERSQHDPEWLVQPLALGPHEGHLLLNATNSDRCSSFSAPPKFQSPAFFALDETAGVARVEVQTLNRVLPNLRRKLGFKNLYLKLDTQGFDLQVLQGSEEQLPTIAALQTEASLIDVSRRMPTDVETIKYLNMRDFDITGLYPLSRDQSLRLTEFDCVMINRARIPTALVERATLRPFQ